MRVLLDECLPRSLKRALIGHDVLSAQDCGWSGIKNGELLRLAEMQFDTFLTADKNLRYQQNLAIRKIAIIELPRNNRVAIMPLVPKILQELNSIVSGGYVQIKERD